MSTYHLPVSGLQVAVQPPTGREDLLLQEAGNLEVALVFTLFDRLIRLPQDAPRNWSELAITDLETLLLLVRREVLGDLIQAETECTVVDCRARVDVSFRISEYLASVKPRTPRGVEKRDPCVYRLAESDITFRLPNGGDLAALERKDVSERTWFQRCIRPASVPGRVRRRIERAMHALAPRLSRMMSGECPECKAKMDFHFDVVQFVLREIRDHAGMIFEDVHLLAAHYKWPEEEILALPRSRRLRYCDALREQRSVA